MAKWYIVDDRDGEIVNAIEASSLVKAERIRQRHRYSHRLSLLPEKDATPDQVFVYEQAMRELMGEGRKDSDDA